MACPTEATVGSDLHGARPSFQLEDPELEGLVEVGGPVQKIAGAVRREDRLAHVLEIDGWASLAGDTGGLLVSGEVRESVASIRTNRPVHEGIRLAIHHQNRF